MLASTMSMWSTCVVDSQKRVLPQWLQKLRVPWSEDANRTSSDFPDSSANCSFGARNHVTKPAPWMRRHMEQWQWPQKSVGSWIVKRTAPQKQLPATVLAWDMSPLESCSPQSTPARWSRLAFAGGQGGMRKIFRPQSARPAARGFGSFPGAFSAGDPRTHHGSPARARACGVGDEVASFGDHGVSESLEVHEKPSGTSVDRTRRGRIHVRQVGRARWNGSETLQPGKV